MAALQTPGDVISVRAVDLPKLDQTIMIWHLKLRSTSDTLVVPGLLSTSGAENLEATIAVSAGALTEGNTTLTITGGSLGAETVIVTRHRTGMSNNLSIDEDPTVGGS